MTARTNRPATDEPGETARASIQALQRATDELEKVQPLREDQEYELTECYRRAITRVVRETVEIAQRAPGEALMWARYASARRAFVSDAEMARALGVHRSQISRWKQGGLVDRQNEERLRDLDVVVSLLMGFVETRVIPDWLHGLNPHLSDRRPIDVLRSGRLSEVIAAIEAEKSGAYA